jgi:hypothetical protein
MGGKVDMTEIIIALMTKNQTPKDACCKEAQVFYRMLKNIYV